MENIWQKLKAACVREGRPILALAPMAGITDSPFRRICKGQGADIVYSEMASVAALCHKPKDTLDLLKFTEEERPYIVQLFGADPQQFAEASRIIADKIRPDGLDINLGCPVPKIFKQGAGSALMADHERAREAIIAVIDNTDLPVSIKARTSVKGFSLLDFLDKISDLGISAIMVHGRKYEQGFSGEIDFETIKSVRGRFRGVILANGGINDPSGARQMIERTQADGIGIGQGALGNPWIFKEVKSLPAGEAGQMSPSKADLSPRLTSLGLAQFFLAGKFKTKIDIIEIIQKHLDLMIEYKSERGIIEMRKHLCWYVKGLPGAKRLREEFVKVESKKDIKNILIAMQILL